MRTGTKFWLAVAVAIMQLVMFFSLLASGFKFDLGTIMVFVGGPVATFTAFGFLNVKASGQIPAVPPTAPGP